MKTLTQKQRIIRHLNDKGAITSREAMNEYGIMRLSSRVCELRDTMNLYHIANIL